MNGGDGYVIVGMCSSNILNYKTWSSCYVFFPTIKTMEKQLARCWTLSVGKGMRHKSRSHSVKDTHALRTLTLSESLFPAVFKAKQHLNPSLLGDKRETEVCHGCWRCCAGNGGEGEALTSHCPFPSTAPRAWLHCWPGTASARAWGDACVTQAYGDLQGSTPAGTENTMAEYKTKTLLCFTRRTEIQDQLHPCLPHAVCAAAAVNTGVVGH